MVCLFVYYKLPISRIPRMVVTVVFYPSNVKPARAYEHINPEDAIPAAQRTPVCSRLMKMFLKFIRDKLAIHYQIMVIPFPSLKSALRIWLIM